MLQTFSLPSPIPSIMHAACTATLAAGLLAGCGSGGSGSASQASAEARGYSIGSAAANAGGIPFFAESGGLALDSSGNAYMVDGRSLRKVAPNGSATTLAGRIDAPAAIVDGAGSEARFAMPVAVAVAPDGTIYVAEANDLGVNCFCSSPHDHVIRKVTPAGVVTTFAGTPGVAGQADGAGSAASFNFITALATDANGNLFVKERYGNAIRKITQAGVVSSIPLAGAVDITAMATGADGTIYAAGAGKVQRISQSGSVTELAGAGAGLGYDLHGIAVDRAGNIYIADTSKHLTRKITPAGLVRIPVGVEKNQGIKLSSLPDSLSSPAAIAVSEKGGLYIASEVPLLRAY